MQSSHRTVPRGSLAAILAVAVVLAVGCSSGQKPAGTAPSPDTASIQQPASERPTAGGAPETGEPAESPPVKPSPPPPPPPKRTQEPPPAKPRTLDAEVAALVRQLGDDDWERREAAQKRLLGIGKPAAARLKAALASPDMEVASRSKALFAEIVGQGFLGVQIRDPQAFDYEGHELPDDGGAVVVETLQDTPASGVGLRPGDFIYSVGGKVVGGSAGMVEAVAAIEPGTEVRIVLYRNGKKEETPIVVGRKPKDPGM